MQQDERGIQGIQPLVSAVIPTRNRPDLVARAVRSALEQTFTDLELIVVIDGPDKATVDALAQFDDRRLRVIELAQSVGGADARNLGVQAARAGWIAFLDDDDEWLQEKIQLQYAKAMSSAFPFPVVAGKVLGRDGSGDAVWPHRLPRSGEPLCEYLFCRTGFRPREGQVITSVVFTRRELLLKIPFTSGLLRHQDTDWYLRIWNVQGVGLEFIPQPVTIHYLNDDRPRISNRSNWQYTRQWLRERRSLMTRRAYSGFIATQLAPEAAAQSEWRAFIPLLIDGIRCGSPTFNDAAFYMLNWLLSPAMRRRFRYRLSARCA